MADLNHRSSLVLDALGVPQLPRLAGLAAVREQAFLAQGLAFDRSQTSRLPNVHGRHSELSGDTYGFRVWFWEAPAGRVALHFAFGSKTQESGTEDMATNVKIKWGDLSFTPTWWDVSTSNSGQIFEAFMLQDDFLTKLASVTDATRPSGERYKLKLQAGTAPIGLTASGWPVQDTNLGNTGIILNGRGSGSSVPSTATLKIPYNANNTPTTTWSQVSTVAVGAAKRGVNWGSTPADGVPEQLGGTTRYVFQGDGALSGVWLVWDVATNGVFTQVIWLLSGPTQLFSAEALFLYRGDGSALPSPPSNLPSYMARQDDLGFYGAPPPAS